MKKVLSIILCVIILATTMSMLAYAKEITEVYVEITEPVAGECPDFEPTIVSDGNLVIYDSNINWVDNSTNDTLTEDDTFEAGKTYQLVICVDIEGSDYFNDDNAVLYINDEETVNTYRDAYSLEGYVEYYVEEADPNALTMAAVEFEDSIMALELVPFKVLIMGGGKKVDTSYNSNGFVNGIRWKSDKRSSYYAKGDRFDANSVNTVEIRLKATGSYYFADNFEGRINWMPTTSTVSDGGKTVVMKYKMEKLQKLSKGWHTSFDGKKFYIKSDGTPYTSKLISVSGKKYYVGKDGAVYTKKLISVSGKKYYMGADGVAYTSKLISVNGKKYYMGKDGVAYTSKLISVNGKKYYMGKDGVAYKSKLISVSGKKYYIGKDCIAYKSKFASLSGKKYYFGSDCVMYKSKTFSVSGVKWRADSNGVCKKV